MRNLRLFALILLSFSIPFGYVPIWGDVKLAFILLPPAILIFYLYANSGTTSVYPYWRAFVLWLVICTFVGFLADLRFDFRQIKLLLGIVVCTFIAERLPWIFRQVGSSFTTNAITIAFAANLIFTLYLTFDIRFEISRVSSIYSIGFAEYGLEEIATKQATFNEFGAMTGCCSVLALTQALVFWNRKNAKVATSHFLLFAANFYALILTGSRSALLATLFAVFLFSLLTRSKLLLISFSLFSVAFFYLSDLGESMINRFVYAVLDERSNDAVSVFARLDTMLDGIQIFFNNPFFGVGYGAYVYASSEGYTTPENFFINLLAESGFIGLILFAAFLNEINKARYRALKGATPEHALVTQGVACGLLVLVLANLSGSNFMSTTYLLFFLVLAMTLKFLADYGSDYRRKVHASLHSHGYSRA